MDGTAPMYDQYFNNPSSPLNNSVRQPGLNFEQQYQVQNSYIDNSGIVSSSNFHPFGTTSLSFASTKTISGTIVPGSPFNIVLNRPTHILFLFGGVTQELGTTSFGKLYLMIDNGSVGTTPVIVFGTAAVSSFAASLQTLGAGTHSVNLTLSDVFGTGTVTLSAGEIVALQLGH